MIGQRFAPFKLGSSLLCIRPVADQDFIRIDMAALCQSLSNGIISIPPLTALKSTSIPPCCVPIPVAAGYPEAHSEEA